MFIVSRPCPSCGKEGFPAINVDSLLWRDVEKGPEPLPPGTYTYEHVYDWRHIDKTPNCGPFSTSHTETIHHDGSATVQATKL